MDSPAPSPCYYRLIPGFGPWLQIDSRALSPCCYRPTPGLGALVTSRLHVPCTLSLLLPPCPGVGLLFPAILALLQGWWPCLQMDCPAPFLCYPRSTPGLGSWLQWAVLRIFPAVPALFRDKGQWLQIESPAPST